MIIQITKNNIKNEIENSDKPILLVFSSQWCGPCKMMAPIIDEISQENNEVKICKVNIDEEPDLAVKFKVMSIPTIVLIKDNNIEETLVGYRSKANILKSIKNTFKIIK